MAAAAQAELTATHARPAASAYEAAIAATEAHYGEMWAQNAARGKRVGQPGRRDDREFEVHATSQQHSRARPVANQRPSVTELRRMVP